MKLIKNWTWYSKWKN